MTPDTIILVSAESPNGPVLTSYGPFTPDAATALAKELPDEDGAVTTTTLTLGTLEQWTTNLRDAGAPNEAVRQAEALDRDYHPASDYRRPFTRLVFKVMCGDWDFEDSFDLFCADRGIHEGGWDFIDGELVYEDWTNERTYRMGMD